MVMSLHSEILASLTKPGYKVKKMENHGINLSPTFNKDQDLVPWIEGQLYIEMWIRYFSNNPDIHGYVGKLSEQLCKIRMFSNPGDKIIFFCQNLIKSGSPSGT